MPRFVVLEHDWPTTHWDLLLEAGPVLRSWRLLAEPGRGRCVRAEPNAEHRLVYLDYEGAISGGRGHVKRWDVGTFESISDDTDRLVVQLRGVRLVGRCTIAREEMILE
jgi:hypothetical protein